MTESAQAGMPWSEIAESAYRAFCFKMRGVYGDAASLIAWADLPEPLQAAWEAAVRQADSCKGVPLGGRPMYEGRWVNWVPPSA